MAFSHFVRSLYGIRLFSGVSESLDSFEFCLLFKIKFTKNRLKIREIFGQAVRSSLLLFSTLTNQLATSIGS